MQQVLPYLFPYRNEPNKPLTTVRILHQAALLAAKIRPPFRVYDLRHRFGSRSAIAGLDLATLKELMGHPNISMTMRYVHPTPEHKQQSVQKLERFNTEQVLAMHESRGGDCLRKNFVGITPQSSRIYIHDVARLGSTSS